jgi:hypothetical protein
VTADADVFINGAKAPFNSGRVTFPPSAAPIALTVVLRGAGPNSGLTGPVELR